MHNSPQLFFEATKSRLMSLLTATGGPEGPEGPFRVLSSVSSESLV